LKQEAVETTRGSEGVESTHQEELLKRLLKQEAVETTRGSEGVESTHQKVQ
jgi:hypothetical protein